MDAVEDLEQMLQALDAASPKAPEASVQAVAPALGDPAVTDCLTRWMSRILDCCKSLGWEQDGDLNGQQDEFGGGHMYFVQATLDSGAEEGQLLCGLRFFANGSAALVGNGFLTLEIGPNLPGNRLRPGMGPLPGTKELVLLEELHRVRKTEQLWADLGATSTPESVLALHFSAALEQSLAEWPKSRLIDAVGQGLSQ